MAFRCPCAQPSCVNSLGSLLNGLVGAVIVVAAYPSPLSVVRPPHRPFPPEVVILSREPQFPSTTLSLLAGVSREQVPVAHYLLLVLQYAQIDMLLNMTRPITNSMVLPIDGQGLL